MWQVTKPAKGVADMLEGIIRFSHPRSMSHMTHDYNTALAHKKRLHQAMQAKFLFLLVGFELSFE